MEGKLWCPSHRHVCVLERPLVKCKNKNPACLFSSHHSITTSCSINPSPRPPASILILIAPVFQVIDFQPAVFHQCIRQAFASFLYACMCEHGRCTVSLCVGYGYCLPRLHCKIKANSKLSMSSHPLYVASGSCVFMRQVSKTSIVLQLWFYSMKTNMTECITL